LFNAKNEILDKNSCSTYDNILLAIISKVFQQLIHYPPKITITSFQTPFLINWALHMDKANKVQIVPCQHKIILWPISSMSMQSFNICHFYDAFMQNGLINLANATSNSLLSWSWCHDSIARFELFVASVLQQNSRKTSECQTLFSTTFARLRNHSMKMLHVSFVSFSQPYQL